MILHFFFSAWLVGARKVYKLYSLSLCCCFPYFLNFRLAVPKTFLPFRRLALITRLPFFVAILARKPDSRILFKLEPCSVFPLEFFALHSIPHSMFSFRTARVTDSTRVSVGAKEKKMSAHAHAPGIYTYAMKPSLDETLSSSSSSSSSSFPALRSAPLTHERRRK